MNLLQMVVSTFHLKFLVLDSIQVKCSLILSSLKREHSLKAQTHNFLLKAPTQVKAFRGVRGILLISNSITAPRLFAVLVTFSVTTFHSSGGLLKRFNENDLVNTHLSIRIPRLSIEEESLPSKPICGNCGDVDNDGADVEHCDNLVDDDDADDDDDEDELVGRNQGGADNCGQTNLADQSEHLLSKPVPLSFQPLNWSTMSLSTSSQKQKWDMNCGIPVL